MSSGEGQREKQRENGKQSPHWAGSPMHGSIPGSGDRDLSSKQMLNPLNHPEAPHVKKSYPKKW